MGNCLVINENQPTTIQSNKIPRKLEYFKSNNQSPVIRENQQTTIQSNKNDRERKYVKSDNQLPVTDIVLPSEVSASAKESPRNDEENPTNDEESPRNDEENPTNDEENSSDYISQDPDSWIKQFSDIGAENSIDELIILIDKLLDKQMSLQQGTLQNSTISQEPNQIKEERSMACLTDIGSRFLNYMKGLCNKKSFHQVIKTAAEILQQVARVNSILAWLSMVGYLLSTIEKGIDNRTECLKVLQSMLNLARYVKRLEDVIPNEKFKSAIEFIVEGSLTCYSQSRSNKVLSTIIATVNSEALNRIRAQIQSFTLDLLVILQIDGYTTRYDRPRQPSYPLQAVGIEEPVKKILDWLKDKENSLVAVVIYGFGGIGKSTVAKAVVHEMSLGDYNYTSVIIYQEKERNKFVELQQQILRDCFPTYNNGKQTDIRNCEEGRDKMMDAFAHEKKPIFLYIDNASRSYDLTELLPEDLSGLPKDSRILMTTRNLGATSMFQQHSLVRKPYPLRPLDNDNAEKILLRDSSERTTIGDQNLQRILKICSGVPLALKHFHDQLHKDKDGLTRCDRLLKDLENGVEIKGSKLSDRLFDFVYDDLDKYSQEAFLDICCFFNNWRVEDVKYIVGAEATISLLETGWITLTARYDDSGTIYFKGEEELTVHEIVAAKGRRLGEDNRIRSFKSFREAVDDENLSKIKGLWLIDDTTELEEEELCSMRQSLRVLALGNGITVSSTCTGEFKELSFLHIGGSTTQLPVELEALIALTVFHGPFSVQGEATLSKLPSSLLALKVMEQSDEMEQSDVLDAQGALRCSQLQKLHFTRLRKLPKLPEGSTILDALNYFILDDFSAMERLPEEIFQLPAVSVLSITNSSSLEHLPESFGIPTNLKQLRLSNLWALKALPQNFCHFGALTHLDLGGCCNLQTLPANFDQLTALTHLSLSGCKSLEALPQEFGALAALKHLELASCEKLQALPATFGRLSTLKYLCLRRCTRLDYVPPSFPQLTALEYLNLCYCARLQILPFSLGELTALKKCVCTPEIADIIDIVREGVLVVVN